MYSTSFLNSLLTTRSQIDNMVLRAKQQQIRNFEQLEILLVLLNEIQVLAFENKLIPVILIHKWNTVYGKIFRWFEDTSTENYLDVITKTINSKDN